MKNIRQFYWRIPNCDTPVGKLTFNREQDQYTIEVFDVDRKLLPISLLAIADNNRNPLTGSLAKQWVGSRVEPPDRANISDILRCVGIAKYDTFELLLYHKGRAVYDKLYLEEIESN